MADKDVGLRENLEQTGKSVLGASRTELYIDMRFMASALSSLGYEMDLSTTSVGTDAVNIRFNPTYVLRLFVEEPGKLNRTYIHMLLHCIFRHMYTSKDYEDTMHLQGGVRLSRPLVHSFGKRAEGPDGTKTLPLLLRSRA